MSFLDIIIYDDPLLREKAKPIVSIEPRHKQLANDMAETMYSANGIGLAGNQVNVLERIIVIDVDWARNEETPIKSPIVMVNPEIIDASVEDDVYQEGCLSLPGIEGDVWRSIQINVRYQRLDGHTVEESYEEMKARCILHEIDHLDGVLFIDRMGKIKRGLLSGELKRLAQTKSPPDPDIVALDKKE